MSSTFSLLVNNGGVRRPQKAWPGPVEEGRFDSGKVELSSDEDVPTMAWTTLWSITCPLPWNGHLDVAVVWSQVSFGWRTFQVPDNPETLLKNKQTNKPSFGLVSLPWCSHIYQMLNFTISFPNFASKAHVTFCEVAYAQGSPQISCIRIPVWEWSGRC